MCPHGELDPRACLECLDTTPSAPPGRFRLAACGSCGAAIVWARTPAGKSIPLDPNPRADGNITMTGNTIDAGYGPAPEVAVHRNPSVPAAPGLFGTAAADRFVSHFTTCPQADSWRAKR